MGGDALTEIGGEPSNATDESSRQISRLRLPSDDELPATLRAMIDASSETADRALALHPDGMARLFECNTSRRINEYG